MIRRRIPGRDDRHILQLIRTSLLPYKQTFFPDAAVTWKDMARRLSRGVTYVTQPARNKPVDGFCHVLVTGRTVWIDMLAVDAGARGRGIGSLLLKKAEQYGSARGCGTSELFVDELNWLAQRFYYKHGYRMKDYVQPIRCYRMSKALNECSTEILK